MPIHVGWYEIAIRLILTALAGFLIGLNRGEHGRPAGLRTTMLVSLAACIAMIQANLLLPTAGKAGNSFVVLDLMRLPLGILSGMGFIGAGAILRRGSVVLGVTTASTLWFVTVLGLCFGGGQIILGLVTLFLGMLVLTVLQWVEQRVKQDRQGVLVLVSGEEGPGEDEIRAMLMADGYRISSMGVSYASAAGTREVTCNVHWRNRLSDTQIPGKVHVLAQRSGVLKVAWTPQG